MLLLTPFRGATMSLPTHCRVAVIPAPRSPVEVRTVVVPALKPGEVLLRVLYTEVCGTDAHLQDGLLGGVPYPLTLGHFCVGTVVATCGEVCDVNHRMVREGQAVTYFDVHGVCGICPNCRLPGPGATMRCAQRKTFGITHGLGEGLFGAWAEYVILTADTSIVSLPDGLAPETLTGGGCGLNTAVHAVALANIQPGETVVVLGVGPVGQSSIALSKIAGAGKVIAIGEPYNRREMAERMGADVTFGLDDLSSEERAGEIRHMTKGLGADVVIEAAGPTQAWLDGLDVVRFDGRFVYCGQFTDHGTVEISPHHLQRAHGVLLASSGSTVDDFVRGVELVAKHQGQYPWARLFDRVYGLDALNEGLAAVREGRVLKAVVRPWDA